VAVITTGETTKAGVSSPQLLPGIAVLDPDLTLGLPHRVTAMTGIDAMVHAIEAFTSKIRKNPVSDMLARQALALLSANIHTAVHQGDDRDARAGMLLGAMLAGQAFANAPVAAVHALAYPLGGHYHIPHGLSNSLVLPAVLRYNMPAAERHYAELAPILGGETAEDLVAALEAIIRDTGLPATLSEADVPESDLPMLAEEAMLQQRLLISTRSPPAGTTTISTATSTTWCTTPISIRWRIVTLSKRVGWISVTAASSATWSTRAATTSAP
jgi:alcohol dehydrogenase